MPELPEVENVKRSLEPKLFNRTIKEIKINNPVNIKYNDPKDFSDRLEGRTFTSIQRRGKFLIFDMEKEGEPLEDFIVHLGMTGALLHADSPEGYQAFPDSIKNHIFVEIFLDDGTVLFYSDYRRFGSLRVVDDHTLNYGNYRQQGLTHLKTLREMGPEPFEEGSAQIYLRNIREPRYNFKSVKDVLLDQRVVAGVGNIYANEACFKAGVNPLFYISELTDVQLLEIYRHVEETMKLSIELGGTSIKDYVDGEGKSGSFQDHLNVYNQWECLECGFSVTMTSVNNRATYYCPICQPEPEGR